MKLRGVAENRLHISKRPCCSHLLRELALRTQLRTAQLGSIRSTGLGAIAATQG